MALLAPAQGATPQIHLRNELIATTRGQTNLAGTNVTGLFLIQFEGHPQKAWRATLRDAGVDLLKYVPDDAYVARFRNASVKQISALSFVRWIGPYRSTHKMERRLAATATNAAPSVNVLLAPGATPAEIARVRALFQSVDHESHLRQGVILRGALRAGALTQVAQADATLWIEPAPHRRLVDEAATKIVGGDDGAVATPSVTQQLGFAGQGVTVCVADTGLDSGDTNAMHPDMSGRVSGFKFYPPLTDGSDGYGHGTHCAGIVAGNAATHETDPDTGAWYGLGVASGANLFIERIFDENAAEVSPAPSDEMLTRDAVRAGAQIASDSWGNDNQGAYDTDAAQFDELVRDADSITPGDQAYILEFSAGNAGPGSETLDSPASGKNVIASGASENSPGTLALTYGLYADGADTMADFSSRGPSADGRIKPDLVAPGSWIASAASSAAPDEASIAWSPIDNYYVYMGGTSMSGPAVAGAAAVFAQFYKTGHTNAMPSPALVKAALINSAVPLDDANGGPGPIPNFDEGWGRVALTNLIGSPRGYQYLDQTALLSTGQIYEQHAFVADPSQPLKITVAYTDVPGFPGAIPALVNDLDLEVVAPDGTIYRGNQFVGGESVPNAPSADNLNNVEGVHLAQPQAGDYLVRIRARNVVEDARLDTAAIDQDFALVISGGLVPLGQGAILLDRASYTAPGVMHIVALDAARAALGSVNARVTSSTETAGETIVLHAAGNYGVFTGAVMTVNAPAQADGKLEIHQGDAIQASYTDAASVVRTANAVADLTAPAISGVTFSADQGVMTISWQTSEDASSVLYYGTNPAALTQSISDPTLTSNHALNLNNLTPGVTYYYVVVSVDGAGNVTTNNNNGAAYSLVAVATPSVLLVDAYETADGSEQIPDSAYTNAIAAAGFSFVHWKVTERGAPVLSDIKNYRIVIWRTTDDVINYEGTNNTLTPEQQFMIQTYLNNGGSFFMSSMEILSRLGDVPFRSQVLQVAGFIQNADSFSPCPSCDEDATVPSFQGADSSPIARGLDVNLDYSAYPSFDLDEGDTFGPDFSDSFTPSTNALAITIDSVNNKPCGMCYPRPGVDSAGRVVFLSFPIDTVPEDGAAPNNETTLMRNILNFLAPGANGLGSVTLNGASYTVPDQVTVEVADSDLIGTGETEAVFAASSAPATTATVTLRETTHPGLFRGFLTLVATNTSVAGQLRAQNGDTISASYFDASLHSNVVATAVIDTIPPVISNVQVLTNQGGASITWNTSKPADALVQYGEAALLSHTAYDPSLATTHALTLTSLQSNRKYYFQAVSRDAAGNTATDDNHGALYTFVTPPALQPPWLDNLETGAPGWSVQVSPSLGSDINWTLGTPNNGLQTAAVSGVNAWGSDLDGNQDFFVADSFLYSPPIDLTGFSQVTLTFWDCFNFSSDEEGQVLISTDPNQSPDNLTGPPDGDFSGYDALDWEPETIDLTPYIGQTIQIVWNYGAVNLGSFGGGGTYYGWLLDDISVTGLAAGSGGTITILRNVGSGSFTLTGPRNVSGSGLATVITNAPPGAYSIQYGDVAFFNTPADQSGTLAPSDTLTFNGVYTYPDANSNGISDLFEQQYHLTNVTRATDSDHDGMTDYDEFIAGTDPTNPQSVLKFVASFATNNVVTFQWSAMPGHMYQLQTSSNLTAWVPASDWTQAAASPVTFSLTNAAKGIRLFRVQVRP
jgi:hypothetical protein